MSLSAKALITVAAQKAYCAIETADTSKDALFELLIESVSEMFCGYCGRALAKATYTNLYLDGTGKEFLMLPNFPVVAIAAITEDDDALTEGEDNDYLLYSDKGVLKRVTGAWYKGSKKIKITYTAGYTVQDASPGTGETALPADLKLACLMQVAREWKKTQASEWGEISRSFPDGSVTKTEKSLLQEVVDTLGKYRLWNI